MFEHTPGPWRWLDACSLVGDYGPRPVVIHSDRPLLVRAEDRYLHGMTTQHPNARLIAAAPCLLEAAKDVIEVTTLDSWTDFHSNLRAAIAKAEGTE